MDSKISNLNSATTLTDADVLPIVNGAETKKVTVAVLKNQIPVNADWNATSGKEQILNKPTIPSAQGLEEVLGIGNEAENEIVLTFGGLGRMRRNGFSTIYTDTTDREIALVHIEEINTGDLSFALPSNKPDGSYILATVDDIPIATDFVPYTGAISDVNLGEFGIQLGNLEFDNTPTTIPTTAGSMYYNDSDGTLDLILKGGNVTLQLGQETVIRVVNKTATNVSLLQSNYQAVRITGAQGQRPKVDLAQATNDVLSAETIGLVTETIDNNQEGFITTSGLVRNINTTGSIQGETWLDGDVLYLSPTVAGGITKVKPIAPNHLVIIGYVIHAHATQGTIFVKVDNGYELDELHNVKINGATNNEVLAYTLATDIWENKTLPEVGIQPTITLTTTGTSGASTLIGDTLNIPQYGTPSLSAFKILANNTNAIALPTEQPFENITNDVYSGTIVWTGGAAPSGTTSHTYSLSQVGNLVTLTINLSYGAAGASTLTNVTIELPSTAPQPAAPSSVTTVGDILSFVNGNITTTKLVPAANAVSVLRLKSTSPNVFEISISRAAAAFRYAYATIQYFV